MAITLDTIEVIENTVFFNFGRAAIGQHDQMNILSVIHVGTPKGNTKFDRSSFTI